MSGDTVTRLGELRSASPNGFAKSLAIAPPSACQSHVIAWEEQSGCVQVQILFATTTSFVNTAPQIRKTLEKELGIPPLFFERLYLQSNGFAGHDVRLNRDDKVEAYTHWSRFTVKQTYDKLMPKRTFTPHISHHQLGCDNSSNSTAVHGPQSVQHGWEWYEMGFFASWKSAGQLTLICFDLPTKSQSLIQSMMESHIVDASNPYSIFLPVSDELLRLYDDSVWSIRNHISQWEAKRTTETDYSRLHEIARHGVHVNETLSVAVRSLNAMGQHHRELHASVDIATSKGKCYGWDGISSRLAFQLQFLENLMQRSSANNARIQNEIALAFNAASQRDSKIQVRIGEEARREASAMKAIAVVTMTFLPATFVSTLFGTNFFALEPRKGEDGVVFAVSNQFWVYWAISAPMTLVTLALWFWWSRWGRSRNPSASESLASCAV
ncbi:hypothetical protein NX059_012347 [Plenodomus lindquistii]|nr:hypothetical protein NX059_012347 [Plenodomus lindquistii]